jgi:starch phosphorylase
LSDHESGVVAYFSMEIALSDELPTYSGGLGVLAGDHLRAAADLGLPIVGVTLCYRDGYFRQEVDEAGHQIERPVEWRPAERLEALPHRVPVPFRDHPVTVGAWRTWIEGVRGRVPVLFLTTDLEENTPEDRALTDQLYGGDLGHRLRQEVVLGLGGVAMLQALGVGDAGTLHLNEGHAALLTAALLQVHGGVVDDVRRRCIFTTHTPVPAGHDRFPEDLVLEVCDDRTVTALRQLGELESGELNMTDLALRNARWVNAVSVRHAEVSRRMFPGATVSPLTNGVHAATWVSPPFADLFDRHIGVWRRYNAALHDALALPDEEVLTAHHVAKRVLLDEVEARAGARLDPEALTLGVGRRAAAYKRTDLILSRPDLLEAFVDKVGPLQIVFSGKAHPRDDEGKAKIERITAAARELGAAVPVVYLPDYSMTLAKVLCAGSDVWLNTPRKPNEASGTSGMKAALNGVPSLSVLDGWWLEGHIEGVTGWAVGDASPESDDEAELAALHDVLAGAIGPRFYGPASGWAAVMRGAIALNGSYFNTERMVRQYAEVAYRGGAEPAAAAP